MHMRHSFCSPARISKQLNYQPIPTYSLLHFQKFSLQVLLSMTSLAHSRLPVAKLECPPHFLFTSFTQPQFQLFQLKQSPQQFYYTTSMPFLYPVEIKQSNIPGAGRGIFALADIPKGEVFLTVSCDNPIPVEGIQAQQVHFYSKQQLETMEPEKLWDLLYYGSYFKEFDIFMEHRDGSDIINHSDDANMAALFPESKDYRDLKGVAVKDIKKGDEITDRYQDYTSQASEWLSALMEKYCPQRIAFERSLSKDR